MSKFQIQRLDFLGKRDVCILKRESWSGIKRWNTDRCKREQKQFEMRIADFEPWSYLKCSLEEDKSRIMPEYINNILKNVKYSH